MVKYFIEECHVDPHILDEDGADVLHSASWNGSIPLVKYLMNVHKSDPRYVRKQTYKAIQSSPSDLPTAILHRTARPAYCGHRGHRGQERLDREVCTSDHGTAGSMGAQPARTTRRRATTAHGIR